MRAQYWCFKFRGQQHSHSTIHRSFNFNSRKPCQAFLSNRLQRCKVRANIWRIWGLWCTFAFVDSLNCNANITSFANQNCVSFAGCSVSEGFFSRTKLVLKLALHICLVIDYGTKKNVTERSKFLLRHVKFKIALPHLPHLCTRQFRARGSGYTSWDGHWRDQDRCQVRDSTHHCYQY